MLEKMNGNNDNQEVTIFNSREICPTSLFHSILAFTIWTAGIHLNFLLFFIPLLFLPFSKFLLNFGRRLARYLVKHMASHFPVFLHVEDINAFHSARAYVFGYEPHSIIPSGLGIFSDSMGLMPLPKIKILASSAVFITPFLRHLWTWCGVRAATKENFTSLLEAGYSCVLVPGGTQETCYTKHDNEIAFLKSRRGFIRIAMETGKPLVPVFCFGQSGVFNWWKPGGKLFVKIARTIKFAPFFFWGILGSPIPYQRPIHVVVGKPIEVRKNPQPKMEEVVEVQNQFITALQDLFERHKAQVGYPDLKLEIM
ncbi:diacylglycerol O-acyltransferase 2 isoform X2 [Manihot esculenta]|uniref:diacylglycerol O-acyltransferase 2 isoform X2 n=1 Tax=Manihot esculenta TaxID=3983 RepID=UPI001CC5F76C|nr:diacylglycerol O-acyltransferase 2 isoform X2 [Manihot esculenta]